MTTNIRIWSYLAQLFLEWEMFRSNFIKKFKKRILYSITVFRKSLLFEVMWTSFVEPDKPRMTIWRMRLACWRTKATNTHSEYVILLFHYNNGCRNAPHCYIIHTLPVLLHIECHRTADVFVLAVLAWWMPILKVHARMVSRFSQLNAEHTM